MPVTYLRAFTIFQLFGTTEYRQTIQSNFYSFEYGDFCMRNKYCGKPRYLGLIARVTQLKYYDAKPSIINCFTSAINPKYRGYPCYISLANSI